MGHPYRFTGLYKTSKHDSRFHLYRLRHSIEISWTWLNEKDIDQIYNDLKLFYLGLDYHTTKKNSIHFAKYFIQQLSNDLQLKHLQSIKIIHFPSCKILRFSSIRFFRILDIDRMRRLCETFEFLQIFDSEKDIAEVNILYFLYMKYEGNIQQICQLLKFDTFDKLKRSIELIDQGIQQRKLPIFPLFTTFDIRRAADDCFHTRNSDIQLNNEELTLTEIFHQFDTITLRGRTSIDRYLNIQQTNELIDSSNQTQNPEEKDQINQVRTYRSTQLQAISQNQGQTPLISPSGSYTSGLVITSDNSPSCLPETSNRVRRNEKKMTYLNLFSKDHNRQRKFSFSSRPRKLPRDLELTNDLYTIKNQNSFNHNYTNNAFSHTHQSIISLEKILRLSNENIDSNV
jgi:hypothetical protein